MASQPAFAALALPDGTRYEGPVVDGVLTGASATYDHPDGSRYTGAVEAGLRHGRGVLTAPGGTAVYDGDWVHGKREGQGTLTLTEAATDGCASVGGDLDGSGGAAAEPAAVTLPRSCSYAGAFRRDRFHGFGVMRHASGALYAGGWADGRRAGRGVVVWPDRGEELVGTWADGALCGPGVHSWYAQDDSRRQRQLLARYVGEFGGGGTGARHGYGEFHYADGGRYAGGWRWGRKHGAGVYVGADGRVTVGVWKDDALVHACGEGKGAENYGCSGISRGVASAPPVAAPQLRLPALDAAVLGAPAGGGSCPEQQHHHDDGSSSESTTADAATIADVLLRWHPRLLAVYRQTALGGSGGGDSDAWPAPPTDAVGVDALLAARTSELRLAAPTAAGAAAPAAASAASTAARSLPRHLTLGETHALLAQAGAAALSLGSAAVPLTLPDVSDALLAVRTAEAQSVVTAASRCLAQGHRGCARGIEGGAADDAATTRAHHRLLASVVGSELRRLAAWRRAAHDPAAPVLYRELLQVLVRLAAVKGAAGALPKPPAGDGAAADRRGSGDAGSVVGSVAGSVTLRTTPADRSGSAGGASLLSRCPSESAAIAGTTTSLATGGGVRRASSASSIVGSEQRDSVVATQQLPGEPSEPTAAAEAPQQSAPPPPPPLEVCVDRYLRGLVGALRAPIKPPATATATPAALRQRRLSVCKQAGPPASAQVADDVPAVTIVAPPFLLPEADAATAASTAPPHDDSDEVLARGGAAMRAHAAAASAAAACVAATSSTTFAAVLNTACPGRFVATSSAAIALTGATTAWTLGPDNGTDLGAGDVATTAAAARALSAVLAETLGAETHAPSPAPCPLPLLVLELAAGGLLVPPLTGADDARLAAAAPVPASHAGAQPDGAASSGGADGRPPSQAGAPSGKPAATTKAKPAATGAAATAAAAAATAAEQRQQLAVLVGASVTPAYSASSPLLGGLRQAATALLARTPLLDTTLVVAALAVAIFGNDSSSQVASGPPTHTWPQRPSFDGVRLTHAEATALLPALAAARQQRRAAVPAFLADVQRALADTEASASTEACAADAASYLAAADGGAPLLEAAVATVPSANAAAAPPPPLPAAGASTATAAKKAVPPSAAAGKQAAPLTTGSAQQQPQLPTTSDVAAASSALRDSVAAAAQSTLVEAAQAEARRLRALLAAAVSLVQGSS